VTHDVLLSIAVAAAGMRLCATGDYFLDGCE